MKKLEKTSTRLIKKYPNRRLYDTETSTYITLAEVKEFVCEGEEFNVVDARGGEDITRSILLQILLEEESGESQMLSGEALTQMIRLYGQASKDMLATYMEKNIQAFVDIHASMAQGGGAAKGSPSFSPELWTQFMNVQGPMMQGMMSNYIEQSKNLFMQMQEEMHVQSRHAFGGVALQMPERRERVAG